MPLIQPVGLNAFTGFSMWHVACSVQTQPAVDRFPDIALIRGNILACIRANANVSKHGVSCISVYVICHDFHVKSESEAKVLHSVG